MQSSVTFKINGVEHTESVSLALAEYVAELQKSIEGLERVISHLKDEEWRNKEDLKLVEAVRTIKNALNL